jgi:hypothetical protein
MLGRIRHFRKEILRMGEQGFFVGPGAWRHFLVWQSSLSDGRTPLADKQPWITFSAIDWLESILSPGMRVFEYGSGGSSLFFSRRVSEVVSAEHDPGWFERVSRRMTEERRSNWKGLLIPPERAAGHGLIDPSDPFAYTSSDEEFCGLSFERYARSIHQYEDRYFDLVVVDGRARPSCILAAAPKAKRWILVDNTEREYYLRSSLIRSLGTLVHFPGPAPYIGGFIRTSVIELHQR